MTPRLPLQSAVLDPCADRRGDPTWLADQWADPGARVYTLVGEQVVVDAAGVPRRDALPGVGRSGVPTGDWVFLGCDGDGRAVFAVAATAGAAAAAEVTTVPARSLGIADPFAVDLAIVVSALGVLNWHRRHPRCPLCGEPTQVDEGGWSRVCPADDSRHFPRVDPAVIMLVVDDAGRALLGRQSRWQDGWFSTLAGFVEPGETLAAAVAREVHEEVGLVVTASRYRGSQPWPFPSSLMVGFEAVVSYADPTPDRTEIADARWFTRETLAAECAAGHVRLPPRFSISRWLIEEWFGAELPGDWSRE